MSTGFVRRGPWCTARFNGGRCWPAAHRLPLAQASARASPENRKGKRVRAQRSGELVELVDT